MKKAPRGRSFASRNPTVIGAIGLVVIAALLWSAFNAQKLPIIGGGTPYSAIFSESSGLVADDEVRIAGVKVGTVTGVKLDGPMARTSRSVSGSRTPSSVTSRRRSSRSRPCSAASTWSWTPPGPASRSRDPPSR